MTDSWEERLQALAESGRKLEGHPLEKEVSAPKPVSVDREQWEGCVKPLCSGLDNPRLQFLAVWRALPQVLGKMDSSGESQQVWRYMDLLVALRMTDASDAAFLSFSLGPVQDFIATANSLRDLWTGSMVLSWLAFQAMVPILEKHGPQAIVFPVLRGNPFMDLWLRKLAGKGNEDAFPSPSPILRKAPCLPNRFLALVPAKKADELADASEQSARKFWKQLTDDVRQELSQRFTGLCRDWDARWDEQVESFFSITTAVLPWRETNKEALEKLLGQQTGGDLWQPRVELCGRLLEAHKTIRHTPDSTPDGVTPPKCSLMGSFEQMGPAVLRESDKFWDRATGLDVHGVRLRKRERFCAIALTKRFAAPAFLNDELHLSGRHLRFPDTATVAAALWLEEHDINPDKFPRWNGQWLHWRSQNEGADDGEEPAPDDLWNQITKLRREHDTPPIYYAILAMDGDRMGAWLRGEKSSLKGPALHAAISEALANFALHVVPDVVEKHKGVLVYAGGDDVLALLPTRTVLACAAELRAAFAGQAKDGQDTPLGYYKKDGQSLLMMGPQATVSAGVAVVHYKEDLRFALNAARNAEKEAKDDGRDALRLVICRRSGEHTSAFCPWSMTPTLERWSRAFVEGASDRWAYHLHAMLPTLKGLCAGPMAAMVERQVGRADETTRQKFREGELSAGKAVASAFHEYCRLASGRKKSDSEVLEHFVTLCQSASFLARGRDI